MNRSEFTEIRHYLGKTQNQMAKLLGTSPKAIQSFEQGWRNIPTHAERQALFLLVMKRDQSKRKDPCWKLKKCPRETKENCFAWEFHLGHLCWFINGTTCEGMAQGSWDRKMRLCRRCGVFRESTGFGQA